MKKLLMLTLSSIFLFSSNAFAIEKRGNIEKSVNFVQIDQTTPGSKDHNSATRWKKVHIGEAIFVGNSIRTGAKSLTEIKYDDSTLTRIGSRSNIVINDRKLLINKGYIWGKVNKKLTKGLKIFTNSAVASIVGTEFFIEVNDDKSTTVTVLEGTIEVTGKKNKVSVTAGTSSKIDSNGNASKPENFKKEEVLAKYSEVIKL